MAEVQITFQDDQAAGKPIKIVAFNGQLDETNVDNEAKKIYEVIEQMPEPNLLLDFNDLAYMNSKSIGYVTDWYSKVSAKKGKVAIARPKPNILDILKVVGITQIISIHATNEEAKLAFGSGEAPATPAATPAPAEPAAPAESTPAPEAPAAEPTPAPTETPVEAPAAPATPAEPAAPAPAEEAPAEPMMEVKSIQEETPAPAEPAAPAPAEEAPAAPAPEAPAAEEKPEDSTPPPATPPAA